MSVMSCSKVKDKDGLSTQNSVASLLSFLGSVSNSLSCDCDCGHAAGIKVRQEFVT